MENKSEMINATTIEFKTSSAEGSVDFVNVFDLEKMAQKVIPKGAFGYIASGAGDTFTLHENIRSFNHKLIVPHGLKGVENPSTEITFDGDKLASPIILAPVAAHKLANEQGKSQVPKVLKNLEQSIQPVLIQQLIYLKFHKHLVIHHIGSNSIIVKMMVLTDTSWTV